MSTEPKTGLIYQDAGSLQTDILFNEFLLRYAVIGEQPIALDKDLAAPPGSPVSGDIYIVAGSATGAWTGSTDKIAYYNGTAWVFFTPAEGWKFLVLDEDTEYEYGGSGGWTAVGGGGGAGDFFGPAGSTSGHLVSFGNGTGKLGADSGVSVTDLKTEAIGIACSDETTNIATGTAKATFRMPYAFTLTAVRASVTTAPTGSVATFDINESGSTILSTKITIDATEKTSTTAATAPVISDSSLADDAEMTIDFDTVGSTLPGTGVKIWLIGYRT